MAINNSLNLGVTPLPSTMGGTGIANASASTITLGGALTLSGAFSTTLTVTGSTSVTLPTSGTLLSSATGVTSVTGTTNRITSSGGTTPAIDISASYVGQSSITTLGTISTGVWGSSATVIGLASGGTNAALTASNGGIFYSTASAGAILAGTATAGQILRSGTSAAPSWSTSTYPATNAINTILYASAANVMSALATANSSILVTSSGGVPSLGTTLPFIVSLATGGTNANLTASNGGIFYSTASAGAILAGTATAGQIIRSGSSTTPAWSTSTYPATNAINTLLYASAANVMSALATANSSILVTSSGGVPSLSTTIPFTVPVTTGGTGRTTMTTAYGIITAGTTATGNLQTLASLGTAAQVLTSNGAGALPSWQNAASGGVTSITGTTGQIVASAATGAVTLSMPSNGATGLKISDPSAASSLELDATKAYLMSVAGAYTQGLGIDPDFVYLQCQNATNDANIVLTGDIVGLGTGFGESIVLTGAAGLKIASDATSYITVAGDIVVHSDSGGGTVGTITMNGSGIAIATNAAGGASNFSITDSANSNGIVMASGTGLTLTSLGASMALPAAAGTKGYTIISNGSGGTNWANTLISVQVSLSAAQINGMYATPVALIANPGAGFMNIVTYANIELVVGGTLFLLGGPIRIQYGSTTHAGGDSATGGTDVAAASLLAAATTLYTFPPSATSTSYVVATDANTAIYISNSVQAFTTGNGTAKVNLTYYVQAV